MPEATLTLRLSTILERSAPLSSICGRVGVGVTGMEVRVEVGEQRARQQPMQLSRARCCSTSKTGAEQMLERKS